MINFNFRKLRINICNNKSFQFQTVLHAVHIYGTKGNGSKIEHLNGEKNYNVGERKYLR